MHRTHASLFLLVSIAILGLFAAQAAIAAPVIIADTTDSSATYVGGDYGGYSSANFADRAAGGRHWGDELYDAGHRFDTTQISVDRDDPTKTLTITLRTMFNGNDQGVHYADLFLDTSSPTTPDSYGYAIALGGQTKAAGVYAIGSASTSNGIWGGQGMYVYGGYSQFKTSSPSFDAAMALQNYTRLDSGTVMSDYTATVSQTDVGGGFYDVVVALTSSTNLSLFDAFDLFWGTGDCGNDAIWGSVAFAPSGTPVDAPSSLFILGAGLVGLFVLGRRPKIQPR